MVLLIFAIRLLFAIAIVVASYLIISPNDLVMGLITALVAFPLVGICFLVNRRNAKLVGSTLSCSFLFVMCAGLFGPVFPSDSVTDELFTIWIAALGGWLFGVVITREWRFSDSRNQNVQNSRNVHEPGQLDYESTDDSS